MGNWSVRHAYDMSTFHVNNIPRVTPAPNIWTSDAEALDCDIAELIETPDAGGVRYWEGVCFLRIILLGYLYSGYFHNSFAYGLCLYA